MGTSYALFRLKLPLGTRRMLEEEDVVHFGSRDSVLAHLATLPGAETFSDTIRLTVEGTEIEYDLDDPVLHIRVDHVGPWALLPIADKLGEYGPLAIFDSQAGEFRPLEVFRAEAPVHCAPICGPPSPGEKGPLGELWSIERTDGAGSFPPRFDAIVVHEDVVILEGWTRVAALDAASGDTRWTLKLGRQRVTTTIAADVLVCSGFQPDVFGVDLATGRTRWAEPIEEAAVTRPCSVGSDRFAIATAHTVLMLDAVSGRPLWKHRIDPDSRWILTLAADERYVLVGSNDGGCSCLDARDGRLLASAVAEGGNPRLPNVIGSLAIAKNQAFIRETDSLSRRRLPDLALLEQLELSSTRAHFRPLVVSDGVLLEGATAVDDPSGPGLLSETNCVVRAWEAHKLTLRAEYPSPDDVPPPIPLGKNHWVAILSDPDEGDASRYRIALIDRRSNAIVGAESRARTPRSSYAVATAGRQFFVGGGGRLSAFEPALLE